MYFSSNLNVNLAKLDNRIKIKKAPKHSFPFLDHLTLLKYKSPFSKHRSNDDKKENKQKQDQNEEKEEEEEEEDEKEDEKEDEEDEDDEEEKENYENNTGETNEQQQKRKEKENKLSLSELHYFRSIISDGSRVVSLSPPKSLPVDDFLKIAKADDAECQNVYIEEYIEGTMITLFFDVKSLQWVMTTRSSIGGENSFYYHRLSTMDDFSQWMYGCVQSSQIQISSGSEHEWKMPQHVQEFIYQSISERMTSYLTKKNQERNENVKVKENEQEEVETEDDNEAEYQFGRHQVQSPAITKEKEKNNSISSSKEEELKEEEKEEEKISTEKQKRKRKQKPNRKKKPASSRKPIEQTFSFLHLFRDCVKFANLDVMKLNTHRVYCFVLQHPFNRIVLPVSEPKLYLIESYERIQEEEENFRVLRTSLPLRELYEKFPEFQDSNIRTPLAYSLENNSNESRVSSNNKREKETENSGLLLQKYIEFQKTNIQPYTITGVVFKRLDSNLPYLRAKILNPGYLYVHRLRNNSSNSIYKFLELYRHVRQGTCSQMFEDGGPGGLTRPVFTSSDVANSNVFEQYYTFFPEDNILKINYANQFYLLCSTMHAWYTYTFIRRQYDLHQDFSPFWKRHLRNLHKVIYVDRLRPSKQSMRIEHIEEYFDTLDLPLLCYTLNQFTMEINSQS